MSVTRGREAAFFFSNYRIRVLRFLYGTLLSAYQTSNNLKRIKIIYKQSEIVVESYYTRTLIDKITVYDDYFVVEFKSGIEIQIDE